VAWKCDDRHERREPDSPPDHAEGDPQLEQLQHLVGRLGAVRSTERGRGRASRIHDANPSVIQGRLTANGQIY
jgi:hypothetical protein